MKIDKDKARDVLARAIAAPAECADATWLRDILTLAEQSDSRAQTHIAFMGTALLAKATNSKVDAAIIKTGREPSKGYSARSLAKDVLVPLASAKGIDLGVTSPEPLNNQPYFRISIVNSEAPVSGRSRAPFNTVLDLLDRLRHLDSEQAFRALCGFVQARRRSGRNYALPVRNYSASFAVLLRAIETFVGEQSEGGRRAQAVAAAIQDAAYGSENVQSGRINDPSRRFPGDVQYRDSDGDIVRSLEVRDKPVTIDDVVKFGERVKAKGAARAGVLAVSGLKPSLLDIGDAEKRDVSVPIFLGWAEYLRQALFWSRSESEDALKMLPERIEHRLVEIEVNPKSLSRWRECLEAAGAAYD